VGLVLDILRHFDGINVYNSHYLKNKKLGERIMANNCFEKSNLKLAAFAGGCFWCMVPPFKELEGVCEVIAGYTGGHVENPTYEQVCSGKTGHYEAVQITYDPETIQYEKLLDVFWSQIDPTDPEGQFADKGPQYQTAIFTMMRSKKYLPRSRRKDWKVKGILTNPLSQR